MKYLIFSDESGKWNYDRYYIRSWVRITPLDYKLLCKEVIFAKYQLKIRELKWSNFLKNLGEVKEILNVNFSIFITVSIPYHFLKRDSYKILNTLENIEVSQYTGNEPLTGLLKKKIIQSTKHTLFFNYFEKQHIKNSKEALVSNCKPEEYEYHIDSPQCINTDWVLIAKECGIKNIKIIKNSEDSPGIELADIVAGCVSNLIKKSGDPENGGDIRKIYDSFLKTKMIDMKSRKYPNPNLIFFQDFTEGQRKKLNIFR